MRGGLIMFKRLFSLSVLLVAFLSILSVSAVGNADGIKLVIDDVEYSVELEDNPTSQEFVNLLPLEYNMTELNNNEKYVDLNTSLTSNPSKVGQISKGDLMLYNDNTLVLFYESFNTTYEYTRIGHVNNLGDINTSDIHVKFVK